MTALLLLVLAVDGGAEAQHGSLQALVVRAVEVAQKTDGLNSELKKSASEIAAFGDAAVPELVPLLSSDSARVQACAGYALGELPRLPESALPELERAWTT